MVNHTDITDCVWLNSLYWSHCLYQSPALAHLVQVYLD